jgi:Flp pilus assembly protein TadB
MLLNPEYVEVMFSTPTGRMLLALAFVMEVSGFFLCQKNRQHQVLIGGVP